MFMTRPQFVTTAVLENRYCYITFKPSSVTFKELVMNYIVTLQQIEIKQ